MSIKEYMKKPLPIVNHSNIGNFTNQYVIIQGKANGKKNGSLSLQVQSTPTVEEILINNFNFNGDIPQDSYLKIVGRVEGDKSIEFIDVIVMQNDFDLNLVNEIIPLMNHREVAGMFFS